jgi:hypothetical protein
MAKSGPNTQAGKATVSRNALQHGLRSTAPIVRQVETWDDWERHLRGVLASLEPDGYLEDELATRIAEVLWRLRRVSHYEAEKISVYLDLMPKELASNARYHQAVYGLPEPETMTPEQFDIQVGIRMLPDDHTLAKIARYEAHLHRLCIQTLHELEAIQLRRQGGHAPLARLDISAPPAS